MSATVSTFSIRQGDTRSVLSVTLEDQAGVIDLTTASGVALTLYREDTREVVIDGAAMDIDADPTTGVVSYAWQAGETDVPGRYRAYYLVTWADSTVQTIPTEASDLILIYADR